MDPKTADRPIPFIEGKIVGGDAAVAQAKKQASLITMPRFRVLKPSIKHTNKSTLTRPDENFPYT